LHGKLTKELLGAGWKAGIAQKIPVMTAQDLANRETVPISPQLREQLILEHLPQVKLIARRIHE